MTTTAISRWIPKLFLPLAGALLVGACAPLPPDRGVEGGGQSLTGKAYYTYKVPYSRVKSTAVSTLNARGLRLESFGTITNGESIRAVSSTVSYSVEIERVATGLTELRVTASGAGMVFGNREAAAALVDDVTRILEATKPAKR
jgi:hypothetical protein